MKLLLLVPKLAGGGAERVALNLERHLDRRRFDVVIGVLSDQGEYVDIVEPERYDVAGRPWLRKLAERCPEDSIRRGLLQIPLIASLIRKHRPEVVVTFMADMAIPFAAARTVLPSWRKRIRWIVREANNTDEVVKETAPNPLLRRLTNFGIKTTYRAAQLVVTPCNGVAEALVSHYGLESKKIAVVANPVDVAQVKAAAREAPEMNLPERFIVAAGRLAKQKGFDLLLRAFAASKGRSHHLVILGEGPERESLVRLAGELSVEDRLHLPGFAANPWSIISRADLFCLSSRWEGLPNIVIEAMICRTPVVVTACPYGADEIVRHGVNGIVVAPNDWQALRDGIDQVLEDRTAADRRAGAALRDAEEFDAKRIAGLFAGHCAAR